jgi:hypothetical protein
MFWPQYWDGAHARRAVAETPETVALVGGSAWFDLRGGKVVEAMPFAVGAG